MSDTFLRLITDDERNILHNLIDETDKESNYRVKIILLKDEDYTVPEIRMATNHRDTNIRKWIQHRFNEKGIEGIVFRKHMHKPTVKITSEIEKKIVDMATKNPRGYYGLPLSTWSLRVLAGYVCLQGTKPCEHYKSYSDKKHTYKTWN